MNARERTLAITTGAVVGLALIWTQGLDPAWSRWQELDEQINVLEQAVQRDEELVGQLAKIRTDRFALEQSIQPLDGAGLIPSFIAHVRQLSHEAGFEPSSLRYVSARPLDEEQKGTGSSPFAELRFELRAKTEAKKLEEFHLLLVASPRHVRVVSLTLSPQKGNELDCSLSLATLAPSDVLEQPK